MRVLVIGSSRTFYVRSYISIFLEKCCEVAFLDVGSSDYANDSLLWHRKITIYSRPLIDKLVKYLLWMFGIKDLTFFRKVRRIFSKKTISVPEQDSSFDVVFYFWGTTLMNVHRETMRKYPHARHILAINTYPIDFTEDYHPLKEELAYFSSFDVLLCATQKMKIFLESVGVKNTETEIFPDLISKKTNFDFKPLENLPRKVAFLGNVDFTQRASDDVRVIIANLESRYDIEIWSQGEGGQNLKQFSAFSFKDIYNGDLNKFLNANFDAVLYIYNNHGSIREGVSLTTRFSLYEGCGLPLIISKSIYSGIWQDFSSYYDLIDLDMFAKKSFFATKHNYQQEARITKLLNICRGI